MIILWIIGVIALGIILSLPFLGPVPKIRKPTGRPSYEAFMLDEINEKLDRLISGIDGRGTR